MDASAENDTIVAVATPPGRGGLGIVRLSGAQAAAIARAILSDPPGAAGQREWTPRRVRRMLFLDPEMPPQAAVALEEALVTYFAAPHSYSGEDVVEIAAHGSPPLLAALLEAACRRGARLAEPGEFTRRAFLHGRLDLTQAEAVRDLIAAQTLLQARAAARQLQGAVAAGLAPLKRQLLELIARLEAGIDFADDDVTVMGAAALAEALAALHRAGATALEDFQRGRLVREGLALAILGRPNVGKSSLFNRLLGSDRAIVTASPGTTRDLVAETCDLDGIPFRLVDTAGIRNGQGEAEQLGIAKSWEAGAEADVVLAVFDASSSLLAEDTALLARLAAWPCLLPVLNKCDLPRRIDLGQLTAAIAAAGRELPTEPAREVSALTGAGLADLRRQIRSAVLPAAAQEGAWLTNARHADRLQAFLAAVADAQASHANAMPHEALLVDLHRGRRELDAITGQTDIEDILGMIFSTFCVGK